MNGVRIYVGNDNDNNDLILNGEAIDLFKDENIQITLKQTDIRDIATNYTDFTQSFTVPASPKNNRIFRYWYDINNDNQWESVSGIPCRIDIGGVFFKKGTLKINGAQWDDNGAIKHYSVEFKANLASMKDKFGDKKLGDLNYLNVIPLTDSLGNKTNEFDYTDSTVYNYITSTSSQWIEFPIISTNRLLNDFNAIKYVDSSTLNGINKSELRPALKLKTIFNAIEDNFDIKFTGYFYNVNSPLDNMHLWMNKNEDGITTVAQAIGITGSVIGTSTAVQYYITDSNPLNHYVVIEKNLGSIKKFFVTFAVATSTPLIPYKIFVQTLILNSDDTINEIATKNLDNEGYNGSEYLIGDNYYGYNVSVAFNALGSKLGFRFSIESVGSITITGYQVRAGVIRYTPLAFSEKQLLSSSGFTMIPRFNINKNLPEISIYDFISSLIKMFNLVIVPVSDPIIHSELQTENVFQIEYFNKYYGKKNTVDITKYTNRAIKANPVNSYKKIILKHADSNFGTNIMYKKVQNPVREYGSLISQNNALKSGGDLTIESKFNVLIWRELPNTWTSSDDYNLNQTWIIADALNEDFDKGVFNKPVVFFSNGMSEFPSGGSKRIGFVRENLTTSPIENYNIFSNVDALDVLDYSTSITFSKENEFKSSQGFQTDKNLYSNYYSDLISGIYSPYAREFEVTADLPKHIYTTISLANQLVIRDKKYNITEMAVNLIDGKTKLKLNNVIEESNIIESELPSGSQAFGIDTISTTYVAINELTDKEIRINYPDNTASLKWRANYTINTSTSGYKVSFTTVGVPFYSGGLIWFDFYEPSGSTIGNHTSSINQFIPVGTYTYDTAAGYLNPITAYLRAKTGNSLTITVLAYDSSNNLLGQASVTV